MKKENEYTSLSVRSMIGGETGPDSSSTAAPYFYLLLSASRVLLFWSITFGLVVYVPVVRRYPLRLAQKKEIGSTENLS